MAEDTHQLMQQAQMYQQQVTALLAQKEALQMQLNEVNTAIEQLEKSGDNDVWKVAGPILLKSTKKDVSADLNEKKELLEVRMKTMESSEKKLREGLEKLRPKLKALEKK